MSAGAYLSPNQFDVEEASKTDQRVLSNDLDHGEIEGHHGEQYDGVAA